jgi:hypothetical protein
MAMSRNVTSARTLLPSETYQGRSSIAPASRGLGLTLTHIRRAFLAPVRDGAKQRPAESLSSELLTERVRASSQASARVA